MIILSETPPSVNSLYPNRDGRRRKSGRYTKWLVLAGTEIMLQRPKKYLGKVRIKMTFGFKIKRKRDIANFWKAVEDLLVHHQIVQDDNTDFIRGGEIWLAEDLPLKTIYYWENFVGVVIKIQKVR